MIDSIDTDQRRIPNFLSFTFVLHVLASVAFVDFNMDTPSAGPDPTTFASSRSEIFWEI